MRMTITNNTGKKKENDAKKNSGRASWDPLGHLSVKTSV